jgi:hypothetical protein
MNIILPHVTCVRVLFAPPSTHFFSTTGAVAVAAGFGADSAPNEGFDSGALPRGARDPRVELEEGEEGSLSHGCI